MKRFRTLIAQSPAITIATVALILSMAGGATAASIATQSPAVRVAWHNLKPTNGWVYGGFGSFHPGYYVDANHVVHLRGSVRAGQNGKSVFRLPLAIRPSHVLSMVVYTSNQPEEMNILPTGRVVVFDGTGTGAFVRDFTSFDGVSYPLG